MISHRHLIFKDKVWKPKFYENTAKSILQVDLAEFLCWNKNLIEFSLLQIYIKFDAPNSDQEIRNLVAEYEH